MRDLRSELDAKFDPTDLDRAMRLAHLSLTLAAWAAQAVWCEDVGKVRLGRDLSERLAATIKDELRALGLLAPDADAAEEELVWQYLLNRTDNSGG